MLKKVPEPVSRSESHQISPVVQICPRNDLFPTITTLFFSVFLFYQGYGKA